MANDLKQAIQKIQQLQLNTLEGVAAHLNTTLQITSFSLDSAITRLSELLVS